MSIPWFYELEVLRIIKNCFEGKLFLRVKKSANQRYMLFIANTLFLNVNRF